MGNTPLSKSVANKCWLKRVNYAINRLPHKAGSSLNINRILFCNDKGRRVVGHPYIENLESVQVKATILEHFKDKKITVFKMKPKKKLRWTRGHRQLQTR